LAVVGQVVGEADKSRRFPVGITVTVHVGPYADVLLPKNAAGVPEELDVYFDQCALNHNLEKPPVVLTPDGDTVRACFSPYFSRHTPPQFKPPRQMQWGPSTGRKRTATSWS
jgi:hypothetical protein